MLTIDADAHVVETVHTWDYMEPADQKFRPVIVRPEGESGREYWLVDGKIRGLARQVITAQQFSDMSNRAGRDMATPQDTREMENVEARLQHMDELGIDTQVLYPTIFIEQVADKPEWEIAICKGYNRWLAEIYRNGQGRLRWACVLPLLDMQASLDELRFSREHGACAIFMRGIEGNRLLHDPYFYPLYAEASRLGIAVGVHIANANPYVVDLLAQRNPPGFWRFRLASVGAFHAVVDSGLMPAFPELRMAFVEASAQWVPYVLKDLRRRWAQQGRRLPDNPMKEFRLYVTCQTDDDLAYVVQYSGEENLLIGTDYGHTDLSTEVEALRNLRENGEIDPEVARRILDDNPRAFYGL